MIGGIGILRRKEEGRWGRGDDMWALAVSDYQRMREVGCHQHSKWAEAQREMREGGGCRLVWPAGQRKWAEELGSSRMKIRIGTKKKKREKKGLTLGF